jgi:hypothetical protein
MSCQSASDKATYSASHTGVWVGTVMFDRRSTTSTYFILILAQYDGKPAWE